MILLALRFLQAWGEIEFACECFHETARTNTAYVRLRLIFTINLLFYFFASTAAFAVNNTREAVIAHTHNTIDTRAMNALQMT